MQRRPCYEEGYTNRLNQLTGRQENMIAQLEQFHRSLEAMSRLQDVGMYITLIDIIIIFVREDTALKITTNFVIDKVR